MFLNILIFIVLIGSWVVPSYAASTTFAVGHYADNQRQHYADNLNVHKTLSIADAEALAVTVVGEIEQGYDYLIISDRNRREKHRLTGTLEEQFIVKGNTIRVSFHSDGRTTAKGVKVSIIATSIFNEIKRQLIKASEQVLKQGTRKAYDKIVQNLSQLKMLHTQFVETQNIDTIVTKLVQELTAIAQTYQEIVLMGPEIKRIHQQQFKRIEQLKQEVLSHINTLKEQEQDYQQSLAQAQTTLSESDNALEQQKQRLSIEAYHKILTKMRKRQKIWKTFYELQEHLESKLQNYSKQIELLFYFLEINTQLYEQATHVAAMGRTDIMDLKDLTDISELKQIVTHIDDHEQHLKELINQLQETALDL